MTLGCLLLLAFARTTRHATAVILTRARIISVVERARNLLLDLLEPSITFTTLMGYGCLLGTR